MIGARRAVVASLTLLAACTRDYPYEPQARTYAGYYAKCRVTKPWTAKNREYCRLAAEWLAFQGKDTEALALHQKVCEMGETESCARAAKGLTDARSAWARCSNSDFASIDHCRKGLTVVPPADVRRADVARTFCERSEDTCIAYLGITFTDDVSGWQRATDLCTGPALDVTGCQALALQQTPIGAAASVITLRQSCGPAVGALCVAAAERLDEADPNQAAARRELLDRGCQLQSNLACGALANLDAGLQARAGCAAGDLAACAIVGAAAVRRVTAQGRAAELRP